MKSNILCTPTFIISLLSLAAFFSACKSSQKSTSATDRPLTEEVLVEEVKESPLVSSFREHVSILQEDYAAVLDKYQKNLAKSIDFTERTLQEITEDTTLNDFYFDQRMDEDGEAEMILKHQENIIGKVFSSGGGIAVVMSFSVNLTDSQIEKLEAISYSVEDLNARKIYLGRKN